MNVKNLLKNSPLKLILLLGVVSLFADMTYEGARSINGQYLAMLGASATIVGITSGLGEFIGYTLRLFSGYIADKTGRYWLITILGYAVNLLAIPLLAWVNCWELAALLMILERVGKSIRTPARDVILSNATQQVGHGWGFGLHEALDQIGAVSGPLILATVLWMKGTYQNCYVLLLIPAVLSLISLFIAKYKHQKISSYLNEPLKPIVKGFSKPFWLYIIAVSVIAIGYADFPLIAYHLKNVFPGQEQWIPVFYALAMAIDAASSLFCGYLFDRKVGISIIAFATFFSAFFAPLVFLGSMPLVIFGMVLWGIGMGAQESVMKAYIAETIPMNKRGTAFGIFNSCFGLFWFFGSATMGFLYDISITNLVIFSVVTQLASIPIFIFLKNKNSVE